MIFANIYINPPFILALCIKESRRRGIPSGGGLSTLRLVRR